MEHILAIDLGSWGATAATVVDGELRTYPANGRLSCAVSIDSKGAVFVADAARRKAVLDPPSTIIAPLRFLGRFPDDDSVLRALSHGPATVSPGPAGHCTVLLSGQSYALPEVVSQIIGKLRNLAEDDLHERIRRAVLVAPLSFGDTQRQSLILAAKLAGLEVIRIVSTN